MQELLIREISKNVQHNMRLKFMKQITHDIGLTRSKRCIHYLKSKRYNKIRRFEQTPYIQIPFARNVQSYCIV
jgi:hypothetical protein